MSTRSLVPASFSEKPLPELGEGSRKPGSSSGSVLLVSNILPGILRPLSNLDCNKNFEKKRSKLL